MISRRLRSASIALLLLLLPVFGWAEEENDDSVAAAEADSTESIVAGENEPAQLDIKEKKWNEFENDSLTLRIGFGLLFDTANYRQDEVSKTQMNLSPSQYMRDFRLLAKGGFKKARNIAYTAGYMYDGGAEEWYFRQTGFIFDFPEFDGKLFVGRQKEGFSTSKLSIGYNLWTNERSAANDAFLSILADGMRWYGNAFDKKVAYNVGWFVNTLAPVQQSYVKSDQLLAGRIVWMPIMNEKSDDALHLAVEARYGSSRDGFLQYKSKPESFSAKSQAVDTGKFRATDSMILGAEAYYRLNALMVGSEYYWNQVRSDQAQDPFFHGGEVFTAYMLTKEIRPYKTDLGLFDMIRPNRSVFSGGRGAWELVLRYSYVDLDSGPISGGTFRRITPMVNWHLSENVRLEVAYGFSVLDRSGTSGETEYLQTRLQFQL